MLRLYRNLDVYMNRAASVSELLKFHEPEYIQYLNQFVSVQQSSIVQEFQQYAGVNSMSLGLNQFTSHIRSEFDILDYNGPSCSKPIETNNSYP